MSRKMDSSPVKFQKLWSAAVLAAHNLLGIGQSEFSPNTARVTRFCNDAEYRRDVMALTAKDANLTVEQSDALCKEYGLTYHGKIAVGIYEGTRRLGYFVGAEVAPESNAATSGLVTVSL